MIVCVYVCGRLRAKLTDTHSEGPASRPDARACCGWVRVRALSDRERVWKGSVDFDISQCRWQGLGLDMWKLSLSLAECFFSAKCLPWLYGCESLKASVRLRRVVFATGHSREMRFTANKSKLGGIFNKALQLRHNSLSTRFLWDSPTCVTQSHAVVVSHTVFQVSNLVSVFLVIQCNRNEA